MKRAIKKGVGVVLIILGFLALITPLSPGSWLILVGLEFLGLRILLEDKLRAWAAARPGSVWEKIIHKFLRIKERQPTPVQREERDPEAS